MRDSIAIISGGLDSVTLLHWMVKVKGKHPLILSYRYGQRNEKELQFAKQHAELLKLRHVVLDLEPLSAAFAASALVSRDVPMPTAESIKNDPQPSTYVPNRNMTFISLAAAYAETIGCREIYYGAQRADMNDYWDMSEEFLAAINTVLRLSRRHHVTVEAPFITCTKADLIEIGSALGVNFAHTWSCYLGEDLACGQCPSCAERLRAFALNGTTDPLPYKSPPSPFLGRPRS